MKKEDLKIICTYEKEGTPIEKLISSSFAVFLSRELEKSASGVHGYVS